MRHPPKNNSPMSGAWRVLVLTVALAFSQAAQAAPTKKKKVLDADMARTVDVTVPQSAWSADDVDVQSSYLRGTEMELGLMSWAPHDFRGFEANAVPGFWISRYLPLSGLGGLGGRLALELGVGVRTLSREANVVVNSLQLASSQSLFALPIRAGFEIRQPLKRADLSFTTALMPTFLLIPRSSLGDGQVVSALPFLVGARVLTDLWGLSRERAFSAGILYSFGKLSESSASAWGIELGYRFTGI